MSSACDKALFGSKSKPGLDETDNLQHLHLAAQLEFSEYWSASGIGLHESCTENCLLPDMGNRPIVKVLDRRCLSIPRRVPDGGLNMQDSIVHWLETMLILPPVNRMITGVVIPKTGIGSVCAYPKTSSYNARK